MANGKWKNVRGMGAALLVALWCGTCAAQGVRLAWDPPPGSNLTYYVYAGTNDFTGMGQRSNVLVRVSAGTNLTASVTDLSAGRWYFAATACAGNVESVFSATVICEVPPAPPRMRTVVLQYSGTLSNFYDVGFFKLRLP